MNRRAIKRSVRASRETDFCVVKYWRDRLIEIGQTIERGENRMHKKRTSKGFSLIELLIVVAIILIIAAIAIPNLLRARMAANEASAVGSIRTLNTSAVTYSSTWGVQFPASMAAMGGAAGGVAVCGASLLIDPTLALAVSAVTAKSGYFFAYVGTTATPTVGGCTGFQTYTVTGVPATIGQSGQRGFFSDQSGVIRFTTNGAAPTVADPPLQ
jgi:type IV pilus assembly protein PilA